MNPDESRLEQLLRAVADGELEVESAFLALQATPLHAKGPGNGTGIHFDHSRPARTGEPEVIYCEGKTPAQVAAIASGWQLSSAQPFLATRADRSHFDAVVQSLPGAEYLPEARMIRWMNPETVKVAGAVAVVTGGTTDAPVAAEAVHTLEAFGATVTFIQDVGVAGIHRVMDEVERMAAHDAVIVAAGMEGALASVVAGLIPSPIIACPTSVGYGATFGGLTSLLAMLSSCAPGVSVVNIDNGFGAAMSALRILRTRSA